jgi:AcrR family transcriptional regulator
MGQDATSMTAPTTTPTDRVVAILEAACRVVVREGAHGLRMASVAEEAGVSKALVHYYFSTRRELLRSAFAFSESRLDQLVDEEISGLADGAEKLERVLLVSIDADTPISEQRALWNEVWSSLRFDDQLKPLVERWYRTWLDRIVRLLEDGRMDGSVPGTVDAAAAGARLAAAADGVDSMLYLGVLDRDTARAVLTGSLRRELGRA